MKILKLTLLLILSLFYYNAQSQVYSAIDEVEGKNQPGFYIYVKGDEKDVEEIWATYIEKFGSVKKGKKGTYLSRILNIPNVKYPDLKMKSKIHYGANTDLKIFVSIELVEGKEYLVSGVDQYTEASIWLENFKPYLEKQFAYKAEKKKLDDLYFEKERNFKVKDRIEREILNNKAKIADFEKKLEEAKAETILLNEKSKQVEIERVEIEKKIDAQAKNAEQAKSLIP